MSKPETRRIFRVRFTMPVPMFGWPGSPVKQLAMVENGTPGEFAHWSVAMDREARMLTISHINDAGTVDSADVPFELVASVSYMPTAARAAA